MQIQHVFHMFYDISLKIMHEFNLHLNLEKLERREQVLREGDKTKYCLTYGVAVMKQTKI